MYLLRGGEAIPFSEEGERKWLNKKTERLTVREMHRHAKPTVLPDGGSCAFSVLAAPRALADAPEGTTEGAEQILGEQPQIRQQT